VYQHHQETIRRITEKLRQDERVLGVIVGGSIAHGLAKPASDVDIMIVVESEVHQAMLDAGATHYYETESATYEGGYIDGKYISVPFMNKVAESGTEPARFAFQDAFVSYARTDGLAELVKRAASYPVANKASNIRRFYAQFEAWKWYSYEAIKHENLYLLQWSLTHFTLFAGRMVLAHNEALYPYHKWFLKVLERVEQKPAGFLDAFHRVLREPGAEAIEAFYRLVKDFSDWGIAGMPGWPNLFMQDSELTWLNGEPDVADV
jgi:hypothetical protein